MVWLSGETKSRPVDLSVWKDIDFQKDIRKVRIPAESPILSEKFEKVFRFFIWKIWENVSVSATHKSLVKFLFQESITNRYRERIRKMYQVN